MDGIGDRSPAEPPADGVQAEAVSVDGSAAPAGTPPLVNRIALVLLAAVAVAALPLGRAAFADLQDWVRWLAALAVLAGLGALAAALFRTPDRGPTAQLAAAGLGLLGVAVAVTWLGPGEVPKGRMTIEYGNGSKVCGDVSWRTREYLRVEFGYYDPDAKSHTYGPYGQDNPDGRAAILIPIGQVHYLVPVDTCPEQQKP